MKVRSLLILTALVSSILGAIVAYLVLTVPNDLQADSLLKQARAQIAAGKRAEAHDALSRIILQYPRTDAAAAATVALVKLEEQQRERIQAEVGKLREQNAQQSKAIGDMQKSVATLGTAAAAAAKAVTVEAPAKKTAPPKKRTPTKKRRR